MKLNNLPTGSGLFHLSMTLLCLSIFLASCATTKSREDLSGLGMMYQNMTAHYNGYFNATEIMKESVLTLESDYQDNYNQILPVFEYAAVDDPKSVAGELDEAIKKSSVVISLHRPSKWTDDCYLLIGQAQYLKQDYESAQKTLEYMINNFDDSGNSTAKVKEKPSKSQTRAERAKRIQEKNKEIQARKKEQAKDRAERNKQIKADKKAKAKERAQRNKEIKADKKSKIKEREASKKQREKEYKKRKKERNKEIKARKKARKKGKKYVKPSSSSSSKSETSTKTPEKEKKEDPPKTNTEKQKPSKSSEVDTKKDVKENSELKTKNDDKDKEDKKKKDDSDKKKDGALAHKPAKPHGMLWLAKTYVERDFITQADRMFRQAESASENDIDLQRELYPSMAHFFIYTEQYGDAIGALENAIETTKKKAHKARYAYIIGQLQMMSGNNAAASAAFEESASWARDYEMEFNAKLNSKLANMTSGAKSKDAIAKELEKMLKDDKNLEYQDQIYFQISKVYLEANDFVKAEEYLNLALEHATNSSQKTEIHYALGDIYFNKDKFDLAYENYTNALTSMNKSDRRHRSLEERTSNLKTIAANLKDFQLQDSLLMLASLSDEELKDRAEDILKVRAEKLAKAEAKLNDVTGKSKVPATLATSAPIASSNTLESKFFAYNDRELRKGEREFVREWGSRPLADDWRRNDDGEADLSSRNDEPEISLEKEVTSSELDDIFKNLPKSEEAKTAAHVKMGNALYNLGMAYRNDIERLDLSSEAFARFVDIQPADARVPEAYYFLYLNAKDAGELTKAQHYASILQDKFPGTKYALIAADPSYVNELLSANNSIESFYDATFAAFENEDYKRAYDAFEEAKTRFGTGHPYISKFALLQAMAVGKLQGKEQYIETLRTVVAQYPNTPEQIRAREIIRFLGGDEDAFDKSWNAELIVSTFKYEPDKLHYVVVVLYNEDVVKIDEAKIAVNNYNNLFHKLEKYSIRSFIINRDDKTPAILIRKFDNKDQSMAYYNEVDKRMEDFLPKEADAEVYAISQHNYREMIKAGGIDSYRSFFDDNYLR